MARLNIEDSIFKDMRFQTLIMKLGCADKAIGALVRAWLLAQQFYLKSGVIPLEAWRSQGCCDALIEVGLADKQGDGIYMKGSSEQFSWLKQKSDAGKANRKELNGRRRTLTHDERVTSSSSSSSSSSNSCSISKNTLAQSDDRASELYDLYPKKVGKKKAFAKLRTVLKKEKGFESVRTAIMNYIATLERDKTEARFIKQFDTFMNCWEDYLDPNVGESRNFKKAKVQYLSELEENIIDANGRV